MGNADLKVSSGQVDVTKEKNLLVWALGTYWIHEHQYSKYNFYCSCIVEKETNN